MAAAPSVPQFASLYVGDLNPDVTEAMLYEIFNAVGPVASIRVCRDNITRRSLGYGYVNFHSVKDAERALDTLNYSSIKGRSCRIMWSQRDPSLRKSGAGNIYVKNLDKTIDNKALYDTFSLFGNILSCKVATDATGQSYGYGFVHYEAAEAATQAIERVNGMQIGEKTVQVTEFMKRDSREKADTTNYTNLYVKSFPEEWTEEKIKDMFAERGPVSSMALRKDPKGRPFAFVDFEDTESAKKAVEELHMKELRTDEEVAKAKDDGKEDEVGIDGHPLGKLYVQRMQTKAERQSELRGKFGKEGNKDSGVNLYVKNLDEETDDAALKALFEPFGAVTSVSAPADDKGKSKGYGFVAFGSPDEATKAVTDMHLKVVNGKPLYVGLAERREARQQRLKERYTPSMNQGGPKGGKGGGGKGGPMGGMGGMMGGMGGPQGGMGAYPGMGQPGMMKGGPGGMPMMGMPPQMMAMMKGNPQMMGMMKGGPMGGMMGPGMMGKGGPQMGMPGMMGKGGPGMMPMQQQQMMQMQMMGKGGPGGPGMGQPMPQQQQAPPQAQPQAQGGGGPGAPLNAATLAAAPPSVQKQMIGEKLFPAISKLNPSMAGKITGMMLEMDNSELLLLLESDQQLRHKVDEAIRVLDTNAK